jgi:hypothetical protein
MCPFCIASVALITVGATSTGGLTAFAVKKLFWKTERKHQTDEIGGEQK